MLSFTYLQYKIILSIVFTLYFWCCNTTGNKNGSDIVNQTSPSLENSVLEEQDPINLNKREFKVLTWNIWFDESNMPERIESLMKEVNTLDPDFIAFQEVTPKSLELINKFNVNKYYLIKTGFNDNYDTIILSKYPSKNSTRIKFNNSRMDRNIFKVKFNFLYNNKEIEIDILTFHLESEFKEKSYLKKDQLIYLFKNMDRNTPSIILGDTNLLTEREDIQIPYFINDCFIASGNPSKHRYTYSFRHNKNISNKKTSKPTHENRFDRIYYNKQKFNLKTFYLIGTKDSVLGKNNKNIQPSDHFGVVSHMEILT